MSTEQNDWLTVLRETCETSTQAAVAKRIGYSPGTVNQVLKGVYPGDSNAVRKAVEGALMGLTVDCPVVGDMPRNRCLDFQRRNFSATNHLRVQLANACPTCQHRRNA